MNDSTHPHLSSNNNYTNKNINKVKFSTSVHNRR